MNQVANIQIFLSLLAALALKTEQPVPGSLEEMAFDTLLSASSLSIMVLGASSLIACLRNRAEAIKVKVDAMRSFVKDDDDGDAATSDSRAVVVPSSAGVIAGTDCAVWIPRETFGCLKVSKSLK